MNPKNNFYPLFWRYTARQRDLGAWLKVMLGILLPFLGIHAQTTVDQFSTAGSSTWQVPVGVTQITVELWGGGGAGAGNQGGGGGGGGGAYTRAVINVTPGNTWNYTVGAGGLGGSGGTSGGASSFSLGATTITANGGTGGFTSNSGAVGGVATSPAISGPVTSGVSYAGGNGGNGHGTGANAARGGGGGGGSATTSAAGGNGTNGAVNTSGTGGTGTGNGGNGGNPSGSVLPQAGVAPGGAGGGSFGGTANNGGNGGVGLVKISYTSAPCAPPAAPTGSAAQSFCTSTTTTATVANLAATGTAIKWYDQAVGGNLLATSTALVNGSTYYATQTVSGCESTSRLAVTATVNSQPSAGSNGTTSICIGQTITASQLFGALGTGATAGGSWSPALAGAQTYTYTIVGAGVCTTATANVVVIQSNCINQWNGSVSTHWGTAANWSLGSVPVVGQNILIPTGCPNYPVLASAVNPSVGDIEIESGASLTIPASQHITITGAFVQNGSVTVQNNGALVQGSSSALTGSGNFLVERNLPSADRFYYIGSPVSNVGVGQFGIVPTDMNGGSGSQLIPQVTCNPAALEPGSPWANLLELRENASPINNCSQSLWHVKTAGTLTNGRGYAAMAYGAGSTTALNFTGSVNNGNVSYNALTSTTGTIIDPLDVNNPIFRGWHLVSNPYPSPLTFGAGNTALTSMGFDAQVQVWNAAANAWIPSSSNTVIPVGQGFQIRNSSGSNQNFSVTNAMRTTTSATFYTMPWNHYLTVTLDNANHSMQTVVFFHQDATDGYDGQLEANRLLGGMEVPAIYTLAGSDAEKMAFNGYAPLVNETKVVTMGVYDGTTPGDFTLKFQDLSTLVNTTVILEDTKLNTFTPVSEDFVYPFTIVENDARNRFRLHFTAQETASIGGENQMMFTVFPNPTEDLVHIAFNQPTHPFQIRLTDLSGKLLQQHVGVAGHASFQVYMENLAAGIYLLEVVSSQGERNIVKIVKK